MQLQQQKSIEQRIPFIFFRSILSSLENMAEEEIVKINRKLQKMIDKTEVVCLKSLNKYPSLIYSFLFRMQVLLEIYLLVYKIYV